MPVKHNYIKNIRLSGYKSIKNVSCDFNEGLNIIIGNNGSGKSNLLEFVYKIIERDYSGLDIFNADIELFNGDLAFHNGGIKESNDSLIKWHAEGNAKGSDDFESQGITLVEPEKDENFYIEFIRFSSPYKIGVLANEYNPKYNYKDKRFLVDLNYENIPFQIAFWLRSLFGPDYLENVDDVNKLTDEYLYLSLNRSFEKYFSTLLGDLKKYTPVEDLQISKSVRITKLDSSILEFRNIVFEYKVNSEWFAWDALSDGTRRLVYSIFTIWRLEFKVKENPDTFNFGPIALIEEPEIGIHPHQLHLFLNLLKEKSKEQQIIITTHSPQVLDILGPNELNKIIIAEIDFENGTVLRHLNSEELQKAQSYFKDEGLLSDYWRFSDLQRSNKVK